MQEQFSYQKSERTKGLCSFSAKIKDVSYGKYAHEESTFFCWYTKFS